MFLGIRLFPRMAVALLALVLPFAVSGANSADWMGVKGASAERVAEPVFGGKVMFYRAGKRGGDTVVLIHGLGQEGARDWAKLIPALAENYDVVTLDLPGFGQSDKGNQLYSPDNFVAVIDAVLAKRVTKPFVLIGHSMGAAIALAYAAERPRRVSHLILADMAGVLQRSVYSEFLSRFAAKLAVNGFPEDAPWFNSLVRLVLTKAESFPVDARMILQVPMLREKLLRADPNTIAAYALVEHDFSRALHGIKSPTLLIWGSEDKVASLRAGQAAAGIIPGARLAFVQGAGHTPQMQMPESFNAIVLNELRGSLDIPPFALKKAPVQGERTEQCNGQRNGQGNGQRFSGDYRELRLKNCADVQIVNARIGRLTLDGSSARIVNSIIGEGVHAKNSRVEITAGAVSGNPALVLEATDIDSVGTRFDSDEEIAVNRGKMSVGLYFSVSEISRAGATPRHVHEVVRIAPGKAW